MKFATTFLALVVLVFSANANAFFFNSEPHPMEAFISTIADANGNSALEKEFFIKAYTSTESDSVDDFTKRFNISVTCDVKVISVIKGTQLNIFMAERGDTFTIKNMDHMIRGFDIQETVAHVICNNGERISIS
jgi:uncharacterized protein YaiI (UPF0178 family)